MTLSELKAKTTELNGCWVVNHNGRPGTYRIRYNGRFESSTKVAYAVAHGFFPAQEKVVRTCQNKDCINPDHLALEPFGRAKGTTERERFLKFAQRSRAGCWVWIGNRDKDGYGRVRDSRGKLTVASRVAYELWNGEIPSGMMVCHKCDNPSCVKPAHLFLGSAKDNMVDKWQKGRGVNNALRGEAHRHAKLNEADVIAIRERYRNGESTIKLGREFGISDETARMIVRRKSWKHLP